MLEKNFFTAGNATFTVETGPRKANQEKGWKTHYTFKVRCPKPGAPFFVSLMTGSENASDQSYSYLGILAVKTGKLILTAKSSLPADSIPVRVFNRVMACIWAGEGHKIEDAGWKVEHAGHCCRCGKLLTVPASLECGIGPECEAMVRAGFAHYDEVPQCQIPTVARLQASYWRHGLDSTLDVIRDACQDVGGMDEEQAARIVAGTVASMRHFKKGKNWSEKLVQLTSA